MTTTKAAVPRKRFTDQDIYRMTEEERWANTKWIVEATHQESHGVWETWTKHYGVDLWNQASCNFYTVATLRVRAIVDGKPGKSHDAPVCVNVTFVHVDGHVVAFYEATSRVVDHHMVRSFVEDKAPKDASHTNATNFHHVIHGLGVELKEVRK